MATPQHPELYEQKIAIPVPSSEIAVDLNGHLSQPNLEFNNAAPDLSSNATDNSPSPLADTSIVAEVNGAAFASNQSAVAEVSFIDLPTASALPESQTEISNQNSLLQLPDTNTTTSEAPEDQDTSVLASGTLETEPTPGIESATEIMISSALEDTTTTSSFPPVVEAQESDLRDTTSPLALPTDIQLDPPQTTHLETEVELPIHEMHGALDIPDDQNVTLSNGTTASNTLPSLDAPLADLALIQDQQPAVSQDAEMADVSEPIPSTKISREREYDIEDEPFAKRTKTEEVTTQVLDDVAKAEDDTAMPDIPAQKTQDAPEAPATTEASAVPEVVSASDAPAAVQNEEPVPGKVEGVTTITSFQAKEITKVLKNLVRTKNGANFRGPVRELWPGVVESYSAKVSHPVDLATMESNLKDQKYPTMDAFKVEVNLLYDNAVAFNGDTHEVTNSAKVIRDTILKKLDNIPTEPVVIPKPPKKQRKSTPLSEPAPRVTAPRRQSKSGGAAPVAGAAATTFALDPNTSTPLIRRDSTKLEGGRPKREIHPPKHKDLIYSSTSRPKNKKVAQELKFCEEVLTELKKPKHTAYADAFKIPVDPVSLNIPNYFSVIKHPMDMATIEGRVKSGEYSGTKDFERDMKLMFSNCYKFNPAGNVVHQWGKQLEAVYNDVWANKSKWFADHAPAETPSSNGGSDDEESEEEVEVEEPSMNDAITVLSERLTEEQDKLIALMGQPKKNVQMIEMQNEMIGLLKDKIAVAKAKAPTTKKVVKKAKPSKPAKKQAPAKKAGPAAAKKSGGRQKYLGTHEKNIISLGITRLPEDVIKEILALIKSETDVDEGDDGEVELDIDVVSQQSLWKIYNFVLKYNPEVVEEARSLLDDKDDEPPAKLAKPPAKKKNKPMSKSEQERKIEQLEGTLQTFERHGSGSQEPMPTVEPQDQSTPGDESSGDESDSEED
ncbi:Bromodomain-containing factor 1 [Hyphodiscus hymeniophilus]|uniref:Bromodomain-containing factor 1 n=1 Tax=Hyphodiscus hymeniophilus TaxID=353542 RepID=A0A9P6VRH7_9HELO|nr:Bromodomain-containing factor 1 [Hyphodiscus hymeniophilus]